MKTRVRVTEDTYCPNIKKGREGYIDGYINLEGIIYATVVVGTEIAIIMLRKLEVIPQSIPQERSEFDYSPGTWVAIGRDKEDCNMAQNDSKDQAETTPNWKVHPEGLSSTGFAGFARTELERISRLEASARSNVKDLVEKVSNAVENSLPREDRNNFIRRLISKTLAIRKKELHEALDHQKHAVASKVEIEKSISDLESSFKH